MTAEHGTGGVSAAMAPHPDALLVWIAMSCGCFYFFRPQPCDDPQRNLQRNINLWFEQRRGSAAAQMDAG